MYNTHGVSKRVLQYNIESTYYGYDGPNRAHFVLPRKRAPGQMSVSIYYRLRDSLTPLHRVDINGLYIFRRNGKRHVFGRRISM